jgi:hypothetical protein
MIYGLCRLYSGSSEFTGEKTRRKLSLWIYGHQKSFLPLDFLTVAILLLLLFNKSFLRPSIRSLLGDVIFQVFVRVFGIYDSNDKSTTHIYKTRYFFPCVLETDLLCLFLRNVINYKFVKSQLLALSCCLAISKYTGQIFSKRSDIISRKPIKHHPVINKDGAKVTFSIFNFQKLTENQIWVPILFEKLEIE